MLEEAEGDILEQVDLIDSFEKSRDKTQVWPPRRLHFACNATLCPAHVGDSF